MKYFLCKWMVNYRVKTQFFSKLTTKFEFKFRVIKSTSNSKYIWNLVFAQYIEFHFPKCFLSKCHAFVERCAPKPNSVNKFWKKSLQMLCSKTQKVNEKNECHFPKSFLSYQNFIPLRRDVKKVCENQVYKKTYLN